MGVTSAIDHAALKRTGRSLEYFKIAWNALEGLIAIVAGAIAGMAAAKLTGRPAIWQRLCLLNSSGGACLGTQLASDNLMEQAASLI